VRVFYDLEFWEDGSTIQPISIGMVTETGKDKMYAINGELDYQAAAEANPWLIANVFPHLPVSNQHGRWHIDYTDERVMPKDEIRHHVEQFLMYAGRLAALKALRDTGQAFHDAKTGLPDRDALELWAYFGAYDHVALCQFWGRMIDLPAYVPMFTHDLVQEARRVLGPGARLDQLVPRRDDSGHDALADALWNLQAHRYLETTAVTPG
jgi:3' exoribonuclease, RNase T-like